MARLPQPGGDDGSWGSILNDYLAQAHNSDGTLKNNSVTAAQLAPNAVTGTALNISGGADGQVLTKDSSKASGFAWNTPTGSVGDATTVSKGVVQLAGDLAGTAASPKVSKINGIALSGTPSAGQAVIATSASAATWSTLPSGTGGSVDTSMLTGVVIEQSGVYPSRPAGYANVKFIGVNDPGSVAQDGDEWVKL